MCHVTGSGPFKVMLSHSPVALQLPAWGLKSRQQPAGGEWGQADGDLDLCDFLCPPLFLWQKLTFVLA